MLSHGTAAAGLDRHSAAAQVPAAGQGCGGGGQHVLLPHLRGHRGPGQHRRPPAAEGGPPDTRLQHRCAQFCPCLQGQGLPCKTAPDEAYVSGVCWARQPQYHAGRQHAHCLQLACSDAGHRGPDQPLWADAGAAVPAAAPEARPPAARRHAAAAQRAGRDAHPVRRHAAHQKVSVTAPPASPERCRVQRGVPCPTWVCASPAARAAAKSGRLHVPKASRFAAAHAVVLCCRVCRQLRAIVQAPSYSHRSRITGGQSPQPSVASSTSLAVRTGPTSRSRRWR